MMPPNYLHQKVAEVAENDFVTLPVTLLEDSLSGAFDNANSFNGLAIL